MAKRYLGDYWKDRTGEEREEFVKLFAAMLARSYIGGVRSYNGSTIFYTREVGDTNDAEVDPKIVSSGAKDLLVNYKMHFIEEDWKVYDVVIDDISLVGNYRAQFRPVIGQSSFQDLIRMMKGK
jgi:phospholipid transport system substrate-binding protein